MSKEVPWYLRPFTEEERRRYAADPWSGVPEHLRPRFLESEIEYRMRIATIATQGGMEPVKAKEPPTWKGGQLKKFLQKAEADAIPAVELKRIEKPDQDTLALISEWEELRRMEQQARKEENMKTWIVKENRDGTVTIDKAVYEELRARAERAEAQKEKDRKAYEDLLAVVAKLTKK